MKYWTEKETEYIRNNFRTMTNGELAKAVGRSTGAVKKKLMSIGCKRTKEELKTLSHSNPGQFKKGITPWNKGLAKSKPKSRFKNGNIINAKQDGCVTTRLKEGREVKYIRLAMCKWEKYNNYLWKQKHGNIPDGMIVVEKDGINNIDVKSVADLELLTRSEQMKRIANRSKKKASLKETKKIRKLESMIGRVYLRNTRYRRIIGYRVDGNDIVIETNANEIRFDKKKLAHEITLFLPVDGGDSSGYKRPCDYENQVPVF